MTGYVVAVSQKEADEIALDRPDLVHEHRWDADGHLSEVKAPPTDPYYAAQYRVYKVEVENEVGEKREAQGR